eukprot:SM000025S08433  [mRNA]  locus=s25:758347:759294:- [translate_table: standard]
MAQQPARQVVTVIRLVIAAGGAKPAPPVGPALGQHGLNLMAFCKDFNARTAHLKPDVPVPVQLTAYKDRSFEFNIRSPTVSYFLKKAAGVQAGSGAAGHEPAGVVTLKHVYEIARIKQQDPDCQYMPLEGICRSVIGTARTMGIAVRRSLD